MTELDFSVLRTDLVNIPKRDWNKKLVAHETYKGKELKIFVVDPQAHVIATTVPVGLLAGFSQDSVLVKAFEKNYKTAAKPGVVSSYGFEKQHGEPIELIDYVFECVYDRATEAEMNRYRHNSKNYESGRYVDYVKHGITIVLPFEDDMKDPERAQIFIDNIAMYDLKRYVDLLNLGWKKQHARRVFGTYLAVESVIKTNLRSLQHMAAQRSAELSLNGREAEPEISQVVTMATLEAMKYLPVFSKDVLTQIGKGYR